MVTMRPMTPCIPLQVPEGLRLLRADAAGTPARGEPDQAVQADPHHLRLPLLQRQAAAAVRSSPQRLTPGAARLVGPLALGGARLGLIGAPRCRLKSDAAPTDRRRRHVLTIFRADFYASVCTRSTVSR